MKPRKVMLMIEVETDLPLRWLRHNLVVAAGAASLDVVQIQANVVQPDRPPRPKPVPAGKGKTRTR